MARSVANAMVVRNISATIRRFLTLGNKAMEYNTNNDPRGEYKLIYLLQFVNQLFEVLEYLIIAVAIMSWLVAFGVVNMRNSLVRSIWDAACAITDPMLRPIRRILPSMGGLDLSPLVLILILQFCQNVILPNIRGILLSS
jgi:YggT family protein